jgi:F-type H+-transporting ATPase subunit alpha
LNFNTSLHSSANSTFEKINTIELINKTQAKGCLLDIKDGIVTVIGIDAPMSSILEIETKSDKRVNAMVFTIENDSLKAVVIGDHTLLSEGDIVTATNKMPGINFSWNYFGKVINIRGDILANISDESRSELDIEMQTELRIERKAAGIIDRESVNRPVLTGILAVDSLIPIGRGQRELIIGDRQLGKTAIALDVLLNNHSTDRYVPVTDSLSEKLIYNSLYVDYSIYVAIGQKQSTVAHLARAIKERNAGHNILIIAATAADPAIEQFLAPYVGVAIGEHLAANGYDALIIYDDLSKHAVAYRQIALLLRRPPGREAYPGDIFFVHSRLLERAAKFANSGSLTALPIIETQAGDISAYIPTNVISITDGQIFLESELFYKGVRPAVNVGLSVSRVGAAAQFLLMRKITGSLKLELAQYREVEAFASFGSDLDEATQHRINHGSKLVELLKQDQYAPQNIFEQLILLFAGIRNYLDNYTAEQIDLFKKFIRSLFKYDANWFSTYSRLHHSIMCLLYVDISKELYNVSDQFLNNLISNLYLELHRLIIDTLRFLFSVKNFKLDFETFNITNSIYYTSLITSDKII